MNTTLQDDIQTDRQRTEYHTMSLLERQAYKNKTSDDFVSCKHELVIGYVKSRHMTVITQEWVLIYHL